MEIKYSTIYGCWYALKGAYGDLRLLQPEGERLSEEMDRGVMSTAESDNISLQEESNSDIEDISEEIKEKPQKKKKEKEQKTPDTSVQQFRSGKKKKWIVPLVIVLVAAVIIGRIVYAVYQAKDKIADALANSNTTTAEITRMDLSKAISTTGTIQSKDVRTITSPLSGVKIDKVNFKVGDMVQKGDIVVAFSFEDINKKIDQIEEDITEEKQKKALDGGDRVSTYQDNNGLYFYNVAKSYQDVTRAWEDLQKARRDLQDVCDQKGDYKRKYEEARDNIDAKKSELYDRQQEFNDPQAQRTEEETKQLSFLIEDLKNIVTTYDSRIKDWDNGGIKTWEQKEISAQDNVEKFQKLYDDSVVAQNKASYDSYYSSQKNDYTLNKGNVMANDGVKSLERQLEQNQDSLDNYIVTAPISGIVTAVNAQEGNGYQPSAGALFTVQAVDVFEVTTQVDEYDINNVKIGQKVAIMTDATGEDELEGRITFIAPTATVSQNNTSTNTYEVKMDIVKKDDRLRLGMSAKLNILVDTHDNVLAVPYDAIEEKEGGQFVIYALDDTAAAQADKKDDEGKSILGIQVIGMDGLIKNSDQSGDAVKSGMPVDKSKAKEIPVQIGLESDYYTEVISNQIHEGMTVLVNSKAGELQPDMDMLGL